MRLWSGKHKPQPKFSLVPRPHFLHPQSSLGTRLNKVGYGAASISYLLIGIVSYTYQLAGAGLRGERKEWVVLSRAANSAGRGSICIIGALLAASARSGVWHGV